MNDVLNGAIRGDSSDCPTFGCSENLKIKAISGKMRPFQPFVVNQ